MKNSNKEGLRNIIFNATFATLTFLFILFFYKRIFLASFLIALLGVIGLIKWKSKITLIIYFIGAFLGTLLEIIAVNYSIWSYNYYNFINIPLWLFFVWGNAAAFLYQTSVEIKKLGVKE